MIHPDQTCGVRGRYIGENVSLLGDVVTFTNQADLPAAVLSLDQEKAFDRVDWGFLRPRLLIWALALLSSPGLIFFTLRSAVQFLSTATCPLLFDRPAACVRAVPYRRRFTSFKLKSWLRTCVLIQTLLVFGYLAPLILCSLYHYMPMTRP